MGGGRPRELSGSCGGDEAVSLSFHLSYTHFSRQEDDRQLSHQPVNVILPLLCQIECENLFSHKKTVYIKVPDGSGNTTQTQLFLRAFREIAGTV